MSKAVFSWTNYNRESIIGSEDSNGNSGIDPKEDPITKGPREDLKEEDSITEDPKEDPITEDPK